MKLTDQREIKASPQTVWDALLNPDVLRQCVPGCQEMTGTPQDGFEATVVQKVGPVKATFKGAVTLSDMTPPHSLKLSGQGKGGPAGFAKGAAQVTLTPSGEGTTLAYDVEANVGGKLAQLGNRIIDGFAKKMTDQFFTKFQSVVEGPQGEPDGDAPDDSETDADPAAKKKGWFSRLGSG